MAVLIGSASIDERGRAFGGRAGDQTGREVYIRPWYSGNWGKLIRAKNPTTAQKMARFCQDVCENPHVGYDQYQRNTLRSEAREAGWNGATISADCETDCSAFMTVCAEAAGVNMDSAYANGNAPTTWTMCAAFLRTGAFDVLSESKYLTSDKYLRRGDILVRESGHTVMVLSNGPDANTDTAGPKTVEEIATEIWAGKWGAGESRRQALITAGYDPDEVQKQVNTLAGQAKKLKSIDAIACEVLSGLWGNGGDRVDRLTAAGYDAKAVQKRVNSLL